MAARVITARTQGPHVDRPGLDVVNRNRADWTRQWQRQVER
ncbi:hypothetical protein ACU4GR_12860 [Methylobacterium oryzae CBMB20]